MRNLFARKVFLLAALALVFTAACGVEDQAQIDTKQLGLNGAASVSSAAEDAQEHSPANSSTIVDDGDPSLLSCTVTLMYCADPTKSKDTPTYCYSGCGPWTKALWNKAYDKCVAGHCKNCASKLICRNADCSCRLS